MEALIKQLSERLGIDQGTAEAATGKAMSMIKQNVDHDTFSSLASRIPGLDGLVSKADADNNDGDEGGGLMGSLTGMASGFLGGSAGNALELGSILSGKGLPMDKMGEFAEMLVNFIKDHAGEEILEQIFAKFPILKSLLGESDG